MRPRPARLLRRYPATAAVTGLTAATGAAQLIWPGLVDRLQRDPTRASGERWRLVTPLLVQSDGLGQYIYNVTGSVVVGVAVESRCGPARWLACYAAAGLAGISAASRWESEQTGGGSSDAVAGLIGALAVAGLSDAAPPAWPAYLYGAHFVAYLTALDVAGFECAALAGGAALVGVTAARRRLRPGLLGPAGTAVVLAGAGAMSALRDPHGVGLAAGLAVAAISGAVRAQGGACRPRAPSSSTGAQSCSTERLRRWSWGSGAVGRPMPTAAPARCSSRRRR